jgi:hypothetical protein
MRAGQRGRGGAAALGAPLPARPRPPAARSAPPRAPAAARPRARRRPRRRSEFKKRVKAAEKEKEKAEKAVSAAGRQQAVRAVREAARQGSGCAAPGAARRPIGPRRAATASVGPAACGAACPPRPHACARPRARRPPLPAHAPPARRRPSQAKKAAEAASKPAAPKKAALLDDSAEELDPTLYFENRVKFVEGRKAGGANPYPHKFPVTISIPEYIAKYKDLEAGAQLKDVKVALAGGWRLAGGGGAGRGRQG